LVNGRLITNDESRGRGEVIRGISCNLFEGTITSITWKDTRISFQELAFQAHSLES
jgi:hypothetical protein